MRVTDETRDMTYGQIAYEASAVWQQENDPEVTIAAFVDWSVLGDTEREHWDEVGRAVSLAAYQHHAIPGPVHYTEAYNDLVRALRAYLDVERTDVRKGPAAFACVLRQAGLL